MTTNRDRGKRSLRGAFAMTIFAIELTAAASVLPRQLKEINPPALGVDVRGRVSVSGAYREPRPLMVFKNRHYCGATVPNETLLISRGGGLANAVISLRPLDRLTAVGPRRIVLDNRNCAFVPHVQVTTVGSEVLLKSSDPILHTVHARMGPETLFNVGLPRWREVRKRLHREGAVRIDCDVLHTWMSAAIIVLATPYYAVSDADGNFLLPDVPQGAYEMEVWHERLGVKTASVSLRRNGSMMVDVVYSTDRIPH